MARSMRWVPSAKVISRIRFTRLNRRRRQEEGGEGFKLADRANVVPLNQAGESAEPGWKVARKPGFPGESADPG